MRNAFIDELCKHAARNSDVVLVVGDLGYSVVEPFAERFPDRFFNAGVAEQNMMGLAAGMASEGCHVFVYSIANFPTFRCAEQFRNDVDHHGLAVTVVAVGGGLAYGNLGYSHHAVQDFGLMRLFPQTLIAAPGDPLETRACVSYLIDNPQPSYLRLGKAGEPCFHDAPPEVAPGLWVPVRMDGPASHAHLTTGTMLAEAVRHQENAVGSAPASLYSMPLWGAAHKAIQAEPLSRFASVETWEDHYLDAGFGSWLREAAALSGSRTRIHSHFVLPDETFGRTAMESR